MVGFVTVLVRVSCLLVLLVGPGPIGASSAWGIGGTPPRADADPAEIARGRRLYVRDCAACHGRVGKGDGPESAFFLPAPRNLSQGFVRMHDEEALIDWVLHGKMLPIRSDSESLMARAGTVEALAQHIQRLPDLDWDEVEAGGVLFMDTCEACHGLYGRPWNPERLPPGTQSAPVDLSSREFQRTRTDEQILRAFREGKHHMPAIPEAQSPENARRLLAWVRALSPGMELFSSYCAYCHGDDGRGGGATVEEEERPKVHFDQAYLARTEAETLRSRVWHMFKKHGGVMPHFEHGLSRDDARAIVRYLAAEPWAAEARD